MASLPLPAGDWFDDGVYFGLQEGPYHAAHALGSTDLKALAVDPESWWFDSNRNPAREPDTDTPARLIGRAVHKLVLEGHEAFDAAYAPLFHNGSTKDGKAERAALADTGVIGIKADDFGGILKAGDAIASNPHLAASFTGGMPEVSVFWTDPDSGVRMKCRIDYLKARATVDLKSIEPNAQRPMTFRAACLGAIGAYRYHGQAAHYTDGRAAMMRLIADGAVYGDHDPAWLKRLSADAAFVFVFWRKSGAPMTCGTILSPDNAAIHNGRERIRKGLAAYRDYFERFADGAPWLTHEKLEELSIDDLPNWALI